MEQRSKDTVFIGLSFVYMALRSRIVWAVVTVLIVFWFLSGMKREQVEEEAAKSAEAVIAGHSEKQTAVAKSVVETDKEEPGRKFKVTVEQGFYFGPEFCEAVLTKFKNQHNRMPTNWVDIRANGGVKNVPPPREGYKYVYDSRLGIIEEVPKAAKGQ